MHPLLSNLKSAYDLHHMSAAQLAQLGDEIRDVLCNLLQERTAHFASNLGVVELCLALHTVFDFRSDRLIWDTGHQIYPHKFVTGRYNEFDTIRRRGGLMGYPNPAESPFDLFMTGHAGASLSTMLGLAVGDELAKSAGVENNGHKGHADRHHVAVIGDGAFPPSPVIYYMSLERAYRLKSTLGTFCASDGASKYGYSLKPNTFAVTLEGKLRHSVLYCRAASL